MCRREEIDALNPSERPDDLDRTDPEKEIRARAEAHRNWGRWGPDDVLGTLNFIDDAKRREAATLVLEGKSIALAQAFDMNGPQRGWRRRTNPVHTMLDTGLDAERGQGFPHGLGGADDVIAMPLQCSTQWDGLGHIFDHGIAWNGRRAGDVVTSEGDLVTGIEHAAAAAIVSRGVLLDVGRHIEQRTGELADGYAITVEDIESTIAAQGESARVGRGDIVLVRTGQFARTRRQGWGEYAGGSAPGLSLTSAGWMHRTEIAAIATDTWGFEVRPNEFDVPAFQPLHQVAIPNMGLTIGEMWNLDELARECAVRGRWDFMLTAAPLPITGAVGSPINPIALL
ncbi:cyclase family protein [Microbacterium sp. A196]|uniref:cyclase family protein n=1 Tax=Microbacterium sp. A196 TaxID=3457320 RepID=UPI003FD3D8E9